MCVILLLFFYSVVYYISLLLKSIESKNPFVVFVVWSPLYSFFLEREREREQLERERERKERESEPSFVRLHSSCLG